jgi:hypothetical protein
MIPVKVIVEHEEDIRLYVYAAVRLSLKFLPVTFTCADFSDHPDREAVGEFARDIVDDLFSLPGVLSVTVKPGSLVISACQRKDWWTHHKSKVEIMLERALEVDNVILEEGA